MAIIIKPAICQKLIKTPAISHNFVQIPQPSLVYNKLNSDLPFKFTDTIKRDYLAILFHKCRCLSFLKNVKNGDSRYYQEADAGPLVDGYLGHWHS